jgi:hypothetical protein
MRVTVRRVGRVLRRFFDYLQSRRNSMGEERAEV